MPQCPKCGHSFLIEEDYHYKSPDWLNCHPFDSKAFYQELESRIETQQRHFREFTEECNKLWGMNQQEKLEFAQLQERIKKRQSLNRKLKNIRARQHKELENGNMEGYEESDKDWQETFEKYWDI